MHIPINVHGLGQIDENSGLIIRKSTSDERYFTDKNGVNLIASTQDGKVEFIAFEDNTLAYVKSSMGYPAYYPLYKSEINLPVRAVMMDLDGTSVRSEEFWIWIIELTIASLMKNPKFQLEEADLPYVSGHSVSEHLQYCINKYCANKSVEDARKLYFEHTHREMQGILDGTGRMDAFKPTAGLKDFLLELKSKDIKIGLVTSGLYEKAWPEILSAFRILDMGDPAEFYDCIVTAGYPLKKGGAGTLGELCAKPHPWLYSEVCRVGLGIPFEKRSCVIGIEDSGAGICSLRLAGVAAFGIAGGNIESSGTKILCNSYCQSFEEILNKIKQ